MLPEMIGSQHDCVWTPDPQGQFLEIDLLLIDLGGVFLNESEP